MRDTGDNILEPSYETVTFSQMTDLGNSQMKCGLYNLHETNAVISSRGILLMYCISGNLNISAGNYRGTLLEGDLLLISEDEIYYTDEEDDNLVLTVRIEKSLLEGAFLHRRSANEKVLNELKDMLMTYTYAVSTVKLIEDEVIDSLMHKCVGLVKQSFSCGYDEMLRDMTEKITGPIDKGTAEKWSAQILAQKCGITERKLREILKMAGFGGYTDFAAYVRSKKAEKLIFTTGLSMKEISQECGFASEKNFRKCFYGYCGTTPYQRKKFLYSKMHSDQYKKLKSKLETTEKIIRHYGMKHIHETIDSI